MITQKFYEVARCCHCGKVAAMEEEYHAYQLGVQDENDNEHYYCTMLLCEECSSFAGNHLNRLVMRTLTLTELNEMYDKDGLTPASSGV